MKLTWRAVFAGFIKEDKNFPRSTIAYCVDGVGIIVGAAMGTSPLTVFIESATGIREGGRTGLTAMTTGTCFFISMFFAPLISAIPPFATVSPLINHLSHVAYEIRSTAAIWNEYAWISQWRYNVQWISSYFISAMLYVKLDASSKLKPMSSDQSIEVQCTVSVFIVYLNNVAHSDEASGCE